MEVDESKSRIAEAHAKVDGIDHPEESKSRIAEHAKVDDIDPQDHKKQHKEEVPFSRLFYIELRKWDNYKRFIGELLGTTILMFFVGGVSLSHDPHITLITHAGAAAIGIMVIIFMFGTISGAHVNPAVTFGFACVKRFPWMLVPIYFLGQVGGAVVGTLAASYLFDGPADILLSIPYRGVHTSFIMEIISSFIFMFLACAVATNAQVTGLYAAVAVAVSIAINIIVAGPVSGASMNPARALGPAILTNHFEGIWLYLVAPFVGAGIGAGTHHVLNR